MQVNKVKRICLWSGPRNISTALMYAFAQRKDTKVFDEPLYAYYLSKTKAWEYHPGAKEIMESQDTNGEAVVKMILNDNSKPVLFLKQMTHHLLDDLDKRFLKKTINIILTRDPKEMIASFSKVIPKPTLEDIAYKKQVELLEFLITHGQQPIVVDSKSILLNPDEMLSKLCKAIGIPFYTDMLNWKKGGIPEDGVWKKYWYHSAHNSTTFSSYTPKKDPFPEYLKPLLEKSLPYYNRLLDYAIG